MTPRPRLIASLLLVSALSVTTAGAQAPSRAAGPVAATVTVATIEWIEQFDPGVLASGPGLNYKGSMFDSMVGASAGGSLSKTTGVVEDWTVSPDATKIVLRLRKGLRWHDGTDATADDLAFTLTRFGADDGTASARPTARKVANLEVVDRHSVRVTLKEPDSVFVYGLSTLEGDMLFIKKDAYQAAALHATPTVLVTLQVGFAIVVHDREHYPLMDLRVDADPEPVGELRRIHALYKPYVPLYYELRPKRPDIAPSQAEWIATRGS